MFDFMNNGRIPATLALRRNGKKEIESTLNGRFYPNKRLFNF
jgi:hypothetical protein